MRDPKIDPQPGDIVRATQFKNERERHVIARRGGDVDYLAVTSANSVQKNCWISTWQSWCAPPAVVVIQRKEDR